MRCRKCIWLDYDVFSRSYVIHPDGHFCGLHGRSQVIPDSEQANLDGRGNCGFHSKIKIIVSTQLSFDFTYEQSNNQTR